MSCPLLQPGRIPRCDAVEGELIPTLHERERFCYTREFMQCPTMRQMLRAHRRLREDEYFALWIAPPGRCSAP
jgi:hypothetical protein